MLRSFIFRRYRWQLLVSLQARSCLFKSLFCTFSTADCQCIQSPNNMALDALKISCRKWAKRKTLQGLPSALKLGFAWLKFGIFHHLALLLSHFWQNYSCLGRIGQIVELPRSNPTHPRSVRLMEHPVVMPYCKWNISRLCEDRVPKAVGINQ